MTIKRNLKTEKLFLGLVKSGYFIVYKNGTVLNTKTGNLLGTTKTKHYINITFGPRSKRVGIGLHRLVWLVFKGDIPLNKEVNHKNGIKNDCRLSNLELVTRSGNTKHAYDIGLSPKGDKRFPEKSARRLDKMKKVKPLRQRGWTYSKIAAKLKLSLGDVTKMAKT